MDCEKFNANKSLKVINFNSAYCTCHSSKISIYYTIKIKMEETRDYIRNSNKIILEVADAHANGYLP